jgi:tetratricopeptide (TPR) repeat protein
MVLYSRNTLIVFIFMLFFVAPLRGENAVDLYKRGVSLYAGENYDEAVFYLKQSLELNSNYLDALSELSRIYYDLGQYEYAYHYIARALYLAPGQTGLKLFSADIETRLERYEIAEEKYKDILASNPLHVDARNGLANLYMLTNRRLLARKVLEDVLKTVPTNFRTLVMLARYYEESEPDEADRYYRMNIEQNSLNPESYYEFSLYKFRSGDIARAIDAIQTAIELKKRIKYVQVYGKYLLYLNRGDEALSRFYELIKNGKKDYLLFYHLATAYYLVSNVDATIINLNKCIKMRDDDEIAASFLNGVLRNKLPVDDPLRRERSNFYLSRALRAKQELAFDLYNFNLKESLRIYPKNVKTRLELADYFLSQNLPERYLRELTVASRYSNDVDLKDKIEIEQRRISYRLGDDWDIEQYTVDNDTYLIPFFVERSIENLHFNVEKIFARIVRDASFESAKLELELHDDRDYSVPEKMRICRETGSPFYLDLHLSELSNSIEVTARLKNSSNNEVIKLIDEYRSGNDRFTIAAHGIIDSLHKDIPFRAHILKIRGDRAVINAGRRSGLKLRDKMLILENGEYSIELDRASLLYDSSRVKGMATVVKVDENLVEVKIRDNDYFRDIDIDDVVIYR